MSWAIGVEGTIGVDLRLEVRQCARVWASWRNLFMTRLGVSCPTVYIYNPACIRLYIYIYNSGGDGSGQGLARFLLHDQEYLAR